MYNGENVFLSVLFPTDINLELSTQLTSEGQLPNTFKYSDI